MSDFSAKYQIAQIIRDYKTVLEKSSKLTSHQKGVLTCMSRCRTVAMGGFLMLCKVCGVIHHHFHSCRNRNCNLCGGMKRDQWVMKRKKDMLPVPYLHMVFTLPHQVNKLCLHHQKLLFPLLIKCAWKTIEQFAKDHRHLGAKVGAVIVLHTWGQNLSYHPHVHCLIPAGGITKQGKWRYFKRKGKYFAPVKQMSKVFRGKFTDGLMKLHKQGLIKLETPFNPTKKYLHPLYKNKWVVYAKKPMPSGDKVIEYIGKYVHRVAISNSRIKRYDGKKVCFTWFNYRTSKSQETIIDAIGFLKQFALHILPKGLVKVRHYGMLACRNKTKIIQQVRNELGASEPDDLEEKSWIEKYVAYYGKNPLLCKHCKKGIMVIIKQLPNPRDGPNYNNANALDTHVM